LFRTTSMAKLKIRGKDLRSIGYPEGPVISLAMNIMETRYKHLATEEALEILSSVLQSPNQYAHDGSLGKIAEALLPKPRKEGEMIHLNQEPVHYNVFGASYIEAGALQQLQNAARLPVAKA